jgi:tetratricopeptide (TPR) repeat protein
MKNDELLFFKIEDYLSGKLPPQEAAAFEREIAADPDLAETVEMHRFEREGLDFMLAEDLRAKLREWEKSPPPLAEDVSSPRQGNQKTWWLLLLAVALLSATVFLFLREKNQGGLVVPMPEAPLPADTTRQNPTSPANNSLPVAQSKGEDAGEKRTVPRPESTPYRQDLIAMASSLYELPPDFYPDNLRSAAGDKESPLTPAAEALRLAKPDYKKAIAILRKITPAQHPAWYAKAQEMLGHAYFGNGQYEEAAAIFINMSQQDLPAAERDQAEWYLLLSLLPAHDRNQKEVDSLLSKMSAEGSYHEFKSEALQVKLKLQQ